MGWNTRRRRMLGVAFAPLLLAGCGASAFSCVEDAQCGEGFCEAVGFCAFPDDACPSGRRFGEFAGDLAGACVDGDAGSTGGTESSLGSGSTLPTMETEATAMDAPAGSGSAETSGQTDPSGGATTEGPGPLCGDGVLDRGEACDDGNDQEADGCSPQCEVSGSVLWSYVQPSDAPLSEQFAGLATIDEDVVVAGRGTSSGGSEDVLLQRFDSQGLAAWSVAHDLDDEADGAKGVVVAGPVLVAFGSASASQMDGSVVVERWVGQFAPEDGAFVQQRTLGPGELFGATVIGSEVIAGGADDTDPTAQHAWVGGLGVDLGLTFEHADPGAEASQYTGVAVTSAGDAFAAGIRGVHTNAEADFVVDAVGMMGVAEVHRLSSDFLFAQAQGIASATDGELFLGGFFQDSAASEGRTAYLERYAPVDDTVVWAITEPGDDPDQTDEVEAVAVAPNGDVLAVGLFWGGPERLTDILLRRFDASGELQWSAEIDFEGGRDRGRGVGVTASGSVYVCAEVTPASGDVTRAYVARIVP